MEKTTFSNNMTVLLNAIEQNQAEIAELIGITPSTLSNYKVGKSEPDIETLVKIATVLNVSVDGLVRSDMTSIAKALMDGNLIQKQIGAKSEQKGNGNGNPKGNLKPFSEPNMVYSSIPKVTTVDGRGRDNVVFVPIKARAGYLAGYGDPEYIETLPTHYIDGLPAGYTFRCFEADGVSMQPTIKHRDWLIAYYVPNLAEIKDDWVYSVTTFNQGITIKRLLNRIQAERQLYGKSDNLRYQRENGMVLIDAEDIKEVWCGWSNTTRQLGPPGEMHERLIEVEAQVASILKRLGSS